MEISGEFRIPAARERVWEALNDPEILRESIPGCQELEKVSETEFAARVMVKVGPVRAPFKGKVALSELEPPSGYKISGEGQGGAAGFARGEADVRLTEANGATLLSYEARATVGGKIAQVGQRLLDSTARKLSGEFFGNFSERLAGAPVAPAEAPEEVAEAAPAPARAGVGPWLWVAGVVAVVVVLLLVFGT